MPISVLHKQRRGWRIGGCLTREWQSIAAVTPATRATRGGTAGPHASCARPYRFSSSDWNPAVRRAASLSLLRFAFPTSWQLVGPSIRSEILPYGVCSRKARDSKEDARVAGYLKAVCDTDRRACLRPALSRRSCNQEFECRSCHRANSVAASPKRCRSMLPDRMIQDHPARRES